MSKPPGLFINTKSIGLYKVEFGGVSRYYINLGGLVLHMRLIPSTRQYKHGVEGISFGDDVGVTNSLTKVLV